MKKPQVRKWNSDSDRKSKHIIYTGCAAGSSCAGITTDYSIGEQKIMLQLAGTSQMSELQLEQ